MKHDRSFDKYASEDLHELARRAGIRSGESRRAKRAAIEKEKIQNIAIRESQIENLLLLHQTMLLLEDVKRSMGIRV